MKSLALVLVTCAIATGLGFGLGRSSSKAKYQEERIHMSVAASAAMGNVTRIWLSGIEKGQVEKVKKQMLDHIDMERMTLAMYMDIPEVRERNIEYFEALKILDQFVKEHETNRPQQAGAAYPPQGVGSADP